MTKLDQSQKSPDTVASLVPLFNPRSVAVIGASRKRGTIGGDLFHNLLSCGFTGIAYPVNPNGEAVQAVRCFHSVLEIPGEVDLAIVIVPGARVPAAVDQCIEKGVKALIILSAGFKEIGGKGVEVEAEMTAKLRAAGVRMVGPNCLGIINTDPAIGLNVTFSPISAVPGPLAFMSQSGALGVAILGFCRELGLGLSSFVSVGNKADVSGNDLLEYWEVDPNTEVILLYMESFGNPRKFTQIARRIGRTKPILVVKSGRSESGQRATSSHTGSLAGVDIAADALFRQAGVIRTDTIQDMFNTAMVLASQTLPTGRNVGLLTNAGGPAILAADACEHYGMNVPQLSDATVAALDEFLPCEASTRNPVDMIASATPEHYERATEIMLQAPEIDMLLVIFVPPLIISPDEVAEAVARARAGISKPLVSCLMGAHGVIKGQDPLRQRQIPSFGFPEDAARALSRVTTYAEWRSRPEGEIVRFDVSSEKTRKTIRNCLAKTRSADAWLPAEDCRDLLQTYGIRTAEIGFAKDAEEAATVATRLGYPVAVKVASDTLTHKSDIGGIRLNLRNEAEVRDATFAIEGHTRVAGFSDQVTGVHVQQMVTEGTEIIIGSMNDPAFGPLMMFGLGGTYVELLKDVSFRLNPLTANDAAEMVREIKCFQLLQGYRNAPPADIAAIEEAILRLSQLLDDHPEILEMDINPMKVLQPGKGCIAVDIRIRVGTR